MQIQKEQNITEADKVHEKWYEQAETQTPESIAGFIKRLTTNYNHDYGTICHAVAASAIGAAYAVNSTPQGGITGFQSGAIMWEFIKHWNHSHNECGLKMLDYDNLLYPQYEYKFAKTISKHTWEQLQKQAADSLVKVENGGIASSNVIEHWKSIVAGNIPFGFEIEVDE